MLAALQQQRQQLKPVEQKPPPGGGEAVEGAMLAADDLSQEEQQRIRRDFFAAGLEKWIPLVEDLTFESVSLPLSREACEALAKVPRDAAPGAAADCCGLAAQIDEAMSRKGWSKVFVKLSTRSPKDAPQILARATERFRASEPYQLPLAERARLFAELVQAQFSVASGPDAVELLQSSERVKEDLEYALEAPDYDDLGLHLVLRRWDGPIPIANEFRGIVWNGCLNAIGQYYHPLAFPELEASREGIEGDLRGVFEKLRSSLSEAGFTHFIIDFAWLGPGDVRIIEINPFDGVALGCFPASTGLFKWDDENDRKVITEGPFELRVRVEPLPDHELKHRLNPAWRDVVAPHAAASAQHGGSRGPAKAAMPPPPPSKRSE